jgi:signal transduction histidine kinase
MVMSSTTVARRFLTGRSQVVFGVVVSAVALVASWAILRHGGLGPNRIGGAQHDLTGLVLAGLSTLPVVAWRRSPRGVFALTAIAGVVLAGLGYRIDLLVGPTAALYLLAATRVHDTPWPKPTMTLIIGSLAAYVGAASAAQGTFAGSELLHTGLAWAVAWFAGERTRLRREHLAELKDRAQRAEQDAERERLLAAAEERARIARDLHDSAGHAISVIAVRAGAARLRHRDDPERSLNALEAIEELARRTVDEIDQIVGTLREGGRTVGTVDAPPGLASLNTLISRHAASGLDVRLETSGATRPLAGAADQAAYRILQEALTNAARHGTGSVLIELAFEDTTVDLIVTNPALAEPGSRSGGGHGLIGMRERASSLGGSFDTKRVNGAFRVRARIPYGAGRA